MQTIEWPSNAAPTETFDVLVVGAGLSGIAAAHHLRTKSPGKRFAILEGRGAIGGTWDLFRYPGVRSDSDMFTLGYSFRPWPSEKTLADGPSIRDYVRDTARELGIDRSIRFHHKVVRAAWSSQDARWCVDVLVGSDERPVTYACSFLFMCSGYYDYANGYTPRWPGLDSFRGRIVHPQFWPEDLDYANERVVIIGSGATAVTLAPVMSQATAHLTMLQRSPSYVAAIPAIDPVAKRLRARLPDAVSGPLIRWKNILVGMFFFNFARKAPKRFAKMIASFQRRYLGPTYDLDTHFTPTYKPWDQRLCFVPDADLFASIKAGKVEIVTDEIERFTETGLRLRSGREIAADIVVTATGLTVQLMGGAAIEVDGRTIDLGKTLAYKGMMYGGVPNLASAFGYTNASWTLKCELTAAYVCRLLNYMDAKGYVSCTPRRDPTMREAPALDLTSGYVLRGSAVLPKQGTRAPWRTYQNYLADMMALRFGTVADGTMRFARASATVGRTDRPERAFVKI